MKETKNWPFNVEAKRRSLFSGEDLDIDQISEERLLFLFDFVLTARQKKVLEDRYRDRMSVAKIAEKEHISKSRIYSLDRIAFKRLNMRKDLLRDKKETNGDDKISSFVPSMRICRSLQKAGIDTIEDLHELKYDDLMRVRNLGEKGIAELERYLNNVGIDF